MAPRDRTGPPHTTHSGRPHRRPGRRRSPPARPRRSPRTLALLLLALTSAACSDLTGVEELRSEFTPPTTYRALWTALEACSGREADFERVRWYWIRSFPAEAPILGQWNGRHEITLSSLVLGNRAVVAHEMLHDLLGGDRRHRDPAWDACEVPRGGG